MHVNGSVLNGSTTTILEFSMLQRIHLKRKQIYSNKSESVDVVCNKNGFALKYFRNFPFLWNGIAFSVRNIQK